MIYKIINRVSISLLLLVLLIPMGGVLGQEASDVEQANKELVLTLLETSFEDPNAVLEDLHFETYYHEDYAGHNRTIIGEPLSLDQGLEGHIAFHNAFSDVRVDVDVLLGDDEYVFAHYTVTGTFTDDFVPIFGSVGAEPIPAHGGTIAFTELSLYRIHEGKVIETWAELDTLHFSSQLLAPADVDTAEGDTDEGIVHVASHHHGAREVANEALIRHYLEVTLEHEDLELTADFDSELWHDDFVGHNTPGRDEAITLEQRQRSHQNRHTILDDIHVEVETIIGDGEYVFARYVVSGDFVEDFERSPDRSNATGPDVIPAHGGRVEVVVHELFHIVDGQIIETWVETNNLHFLTQLMTPPE